MNFKIDTPYSKAEYHGKLLKYIESGYQVKVLCKHYVGLEYDDKVVNLMIPVER